MKRFWALLTVLCILWASAAAVALGGERTVELTGESFTLYRVQEEGETDALQYKLDYPAFDSEDPSLVEYLTGAVAAPLLALRRTPPMAGAAEGVKDYTRMMFYASLDFPGILSLEATVLNRSADMTVNEMLFFYRIIDLNARRELTVYDLFTQPREEVDRAIRGAVFAVISAQGLAIAQDAAQVPAPNSLKLTRDVFQCLYAKGTVAEKATTVNVPWADLGLTPSALLTANGAAQGTAEPAVMDAGAEGAADESPATDTLSADTALAELSALTGDALAARLMDNDWQTMGYMLRFEPDGTVADPTGGTPLFTGYAITNGGVSLNTAERDDQYAAVTEDVDGLLFTFDTETSDFDAMMLEPVTATAPTPQPAATPVPPIDAATPTPMPLTGEDADVAAFLAQGLWKPLGTDGNTYYQFLPDGRLLTIDVTPYTISDGALQSDALAGEVLLGGTAFTLVAADGAQAGFVLNREATAVPAQAFVTASPTPQPTATPAPTPTPVVSLTPTPTASPTPEPTLSPYEQAAASAPLLATLSDARFEKRQTLKVYSAPDENSFRDSKAQVTTDETVEIFGVTGEWVLVGYPIGNGSRGRIGYIDDSTLADADNVAQIAFTDIKLTLTKKANATDDPLRGKTKLFELPKAAEVMLLAFLGDDWAYVETTYKDKPCRAFIPRTALMPQ
jgi:hypothetical protein